MLVIGVMIALLAIYMHMLAVISFSKKIKKGIYQKNDTSGTFEQQRILSQFFILRVSCMSAVDVQRNP